MPFICLRKENQRKILRSLFWENPQILLQIVTFQIDWYLLSDFSVGINDIDKMITMREVTPIVGSPTRIFGSIA